MEKITLEVSLTGSFGNLQRERHVLFVAVDKQGRVLTGQKPAFYPEGITRLLGGGVDPHETFEAAAIREASEELNITLTNSQIEKIAEFNIIAHTPEKTYQLTTVLFYFEVPDEVQAGDDVTGYIHMNPAQLDELVTSYENLKTDYIYKSGEYSHSWGDYGKVYGPIHKFVSEFMKTRKNQ